MYFKSKGLAFVFLILVVFTYSQNINVGFRSSRLLHIYPNYEFPSPDYWAATGKSMSSKFSNSTPASVWIVGLYWGDGNMRLNFPSQGMNPSHVQFINTDENEEYLTRFDKEGYNVWLQVEPGAANLDSLIEIVLNRYKKHKCVKGFGIDMEWLNAQIYPDGQKLNDSLAERWEKKVKSIDTSYTLFLKHFWPSWMPPKYRGNIIFVDDSQQFSTLTDIVDEFSWWGSSFPQNKVMFQFGYPDDEIWWGIYKDPMKAIGDSILKNVSNCSGLIWVDFTINTIYPIKSDTSQDSVHVTPSCNLINLIHWDITSDSYGSKVDTGNGILQNHIVTADFFQTQQLNDSTWPWTDLRAYFKDSLYAVTDVEVKYKADKGMIITLNQPPLDNYGESFSKVIPISTDWNTVKIKVKDFKQPTWSQNITTLDLSNVKSISFVPYFIYPEGGSGKIEIQELTLYGYQCVLGIQELKNGKKKFLTIKSCNEKDMFVSVSRENDFNFSFYTSEGKLISRFKQHIQVGEQIVHFNLSDISSQTVFIVVSGDDIQTVRKVFFR